MKKLIIFFATQGLLLTSAIANETTNRTVVFVRDLPNNLHLEVVRESVPLKLVPQTLHEEKITFSLGGNEITTTGKACSPPSPDRADRFFVETHQNGQTNLWSDRVLIKPHYENRTEIVFRDLLQESNATVYLYQEQQQIWAIGSSLVVTIVLSGSASGYTNVTTQESVLWSPAAGNPYYLNSAKLAGSIEAGTLAVEMTTSVSGNGGKNEVHRFLKGKWERVDDKSAP
jgi:hypothetical protein